MINQLNLMYSKKMWVPILKLLRHLNTVIQLFTGWTKVQSLTACMAIHKFAKQWKVLRGYLEIFSHGWSLGYSDLPYGKYEASLRVFLRKKPLACGLTFAFGKSLCRLQTCPRVSLRTLGIVFQTTPAHFPPLSHTASACN